MEKILKALFSAVLVLGMINLPAYAQTSIAELTQTLSDKQQEIKYLQQEIGFAKSRHKASQTKLKAYEDDLAEKQNELKNAQARYATDPSPENEQFLRNAEQRIELADLSIKSRISSVVRLETKEAELTTKLATLKAEVAKLDSQVNQKQLAQKVEQKTESIKSQMAEQASLLQKRLEALQRENERLRQIAFSETQKRELAQEQATSALERAEAAELALAQANGTNSESAEDVLAEDDNLSARDRAKAEMDRVRAKLAAGANGSRGVNLSLRGTSGTDYSPFEHLGAQQYRAEAVIERATSRFRVAGRTYLVRVSEEGLGKKFVFLYDMSDPEKPRFVTFKKDLLAEPGQVAAE